MSVVALYVESLTQCNFLSFEEGNPNLVWILPNEVVGAVCGSIEPRLPAKTMADPQADADTVWTADYLSFLATPPRVAGSVGGLILKLAVAQPQSGEFCAAGIINLERIELSPLFTRHTVPMWDPLGRLTFHATVQIAAQMRWPTHAAEPSACDGCAPEFLCPDSDPQAKHLAECLRGSVRFSNMHDDDELYMAEIVDSSDEPGVAEAEGTRTVAVPSKAADAAWSATEALLRQRGVSETSTVDTLDGVDSSCTGAKDARAALDAVEAALAKLRVALKLVKQFSEKKQISLEELLSDSSVPSTTSPHDLLLEVPKLRELLAAQKRLQRVLAADALRKTCASREGEPPQSVLSLVQ